MKILAAWRDNAANYYRVQAPFLVLRQMGYDVDVRVPNIEDAAEYDVLWLQMHADPIMDIVIREFHDAGKMVVYDVDDWLFGMSPSWTGYDQFYSRGSGEKLGRMILFERALLAADIVTCTTEYLARKLREIVSSPVVVLPNCILMGDWDILPEQKHDKDGPVLGWFGTGNHWDDLVEIADAVDEALQEVGGYLALMGAPEVTACFPDRLRQRTMVSPLVPMAGFHKMRLLIKACDAGLAWATNRLEVSRCRSPLKALQWGAAGVPVVASETVYGDVLGDSHFLPCPTPEALKREIVKTLTASDGKANAKQWWSVIWRNHSYETQSIRWIEALKYGGKKDAGGYGEWYDSMLRSEID